MMEVLKLNVMIKEFKQQMINFNKQMKNDDYVENELSR